MIPGRHDRQQQQHEHAAHAVRAAAAKAADADGSAQASAQAGAWAAFWASRQHHPHPANTAGDGPSTPDVVDSSDTIDDALSDGPEPCDPATAALLRDIGTASPAPYSVQAHGIVLALAPVALLATNPDTAAAADATPGSQPAHAAPLPAGPAGLPAGAWVVTHVSSAALPLLGRQPADLLGGPVDAIVAPHHQALLASEIEGLHAISATDDSIHTTAFDALSASGRPVPCYCAMHRSGDLLVLEIDIVAECDKAAWPAPSEGGRPAPDSAADQQQDLVHPLAPRSLLNAFLRSSSRTTPVSAGGKTLYLPHPSSRFFDSSAEIIELVSTTESVLHQLNDSRPRLALMSRVLLHFSQFESIKLFRFDDSEPGVMQLEDLDLVENAASADPAVQRNLPKLSIAREAWNGAVIANVRTRIVHDVSARSASIVKLPSMPDLCLDRCVLRPPMFFQQALLKSMGMASCVSIRINCFSKMWGAFVIMSKRPRRLPFRLLQFMGLLTSNFSKFIERQILQTQLDSQQHLTDRTLQHVVAGSQESTLATTPPETPMLPMIRVLSRGQTPPQSSIYDNTSTASHTRTDLTQVASEMTTAVSSPMPLRPGQTPSIGTLTTAHRSLTQVPLEETRFLEQQHSALFGLPIESLQNADPAIHASAVREAASYLVSCVGDLLTFFNADAAVFCVNSDKRVIGPTNLNQELINAMRYLETKQIRFIMACRNLRRDFASASTEGDTHEPVFKELAGLLHIPLSANGDAFISFFRLPRNDVDDETETESMRSESDLRDGDTVMGDGGLVSGSARIHRHMDMVGAHRSGLGVAEEDEDDERLSSAPWTSHDENVARLLQVLYWWFISVYQEREMATQNDRLKNLMLSNISREVRTPLNSIINLLELMDEEGGDGAEDRLKEYLQQAQEASQSLVHIVNYLLFLTQIDAGKMILRSESFMLRSCLHSTVQSFQSLANKKGLQLALNIDPQLEDEKIQGDSSKLCQIIAILCDNAVAYTERGRITASCHLVQKTDELLSIQFDLEDTGIGIPKEKLKLIQEDIARCRMSRQPSMNGAGLGLAILARLLKQLKGRLSIRTKAGQGSTFSVQLSFLRSTYDQEKKHIEAKMSDIKTINTETLRKPMGNHVINVLVVDDNQVNRQVLLRRLSKDGHTVTLASSGEEALSVFKQRALEVFGASDGAESSSGTQARPTRVTEESDEPDQRLLANPFATLNEAIGACTKRRRGGSAPGEPAAFDLILMDVQMPGWSGNDTARQIRSFESELGIDKVPIFGVSGAVHSSDQEVCRSSGMSGFIVKPVDFRILRTIISDVVTGRSGNQASGWF
ncbi:hypothetical protein HK105_200794 [Polyrhizophydium stewartii]|uniref:Uncharacterized protein n=1 Tax=Polyrhizophydium stewartii TaxID=2732419 RepID=A0ABR4NK21_9FUNG